MQRKVADRHDVHPVFEERSFPPHQPFEIGNPEPRSEAAEQHEVLGAGDDGGRVDLHLAEPGDHVLYRGSARSVQQLAHHGELPRTAAGDANRLGHGPRA